MMTVVALGALMIYAFIVPPVLTFVLDVNAILAVAISFVAACHLDKLRHTFERV